MKIRAINNNDFIEYDVILTYHCDNYNKDYVVYTNNTYTESKELVIYIKEYNINSLECNISNIESEKEFTFIKTKINSILLTLKNEYNKLIVLE